MKYIFERSPNQILKDYLYVLFQMKTFKNDNHIFVHDFRKKISN